MKEGDAAMEKEEIKKALRETATDNRISCSQARKLAERLGVPPQMIGKVCDELGIKIYACELGCFG